MCQDFGSFALHRLSRGFYESIIALGRLPSRLLDPSIFPSRVKKSKSHERELDERADLVTRIFFFSINVDYTQN